MTGVLDNQSCHSNADSSAGDLADTAKNEAVVVFNEQTNYVPRRTIITVGGCRLEFHAIGALITMFFIRSFWPALVLTCWL